MSKASVVVGAVCVAVALSSVGYGVYASRRSEARIAALEARLAETVGGKTKLLTDANLSSDEITTLTDLAEAVGDNPYTGEITVSRAVYEINPATDRYTWFFKNRTLTIKSGLITAVSDEAYAPRTL